MSVGKILLTTQVLHLLLKLCMQCLKNWFRLLHKLPLYFLYLSDTQSIVVNTTHTQFESYDLL